MKMAQLISHKITISGLQITMASLQISYATLKFFTDLDHHCHIYIMFNSDTLLLQIF